VRNFQIFAILIVLGYFLLLIESTKIAFPLVFVFSAIVLLLFRDTKSFLLVFILGLMSDSGRVLNFGMTPIFSFLTFYVVKFYEQYFGKNDIGAITAIIILASFLYSYFLNFPFLNIILVVIFIIISWVAYLTLNSFISKK